MSFSLTQLRKEWFSNIRSDVLAGLVVALALIPEAIGFAIVAHVDPKVGLYASFSIAVITAITGGRPALISAATASTAVLMVSLVRDHGLQYLFAATILAGVLQMVMGSLRLGNLMRFVSRSVMTGFVNSLAILIFMAQLPQLIGVPHMTYVFVAAGLAIIYLFPRLTKMVPSPLVCIIVLTAISLYMHLDLRTVGDMGQLPSTLPVFLIPQIPLNISTLLIVLPYSAAIAVVGLLETLMTAAIVDDMTDTPSNKNRECIGQGIANFCTGFIGGMAGCAMIGQTVINVKSGGRGRLSTLCAGIFLLILCVVLGPWVSEVPMAALVAVMVMVSVSTFNWKSFRELKTNPRSSSFVMLATVGIVVATRNLAIGVLVGVLMSGILFAWKISRQFRITSMQSEDKCARIYTVEGQVFFTTADAFVKAFDFHENLEEVTIDVSGAQIWDISSVSALDTVVTKFRRKNTDVHIVGLNAASEQMLDRHSIHDRPEELAA